MKKQKTVYGPITASAVAIVLKEIVRRASAAIKKMRFDFEVHSKIPLDPKKDADFWTTADRAAQEICLKSITECFPLFGIVAEEGNYRQGCRIKGVNAFITVDGLDGTKAFMRKQSHGVGCMISLVWDGVVIAAYVCDVFAGETFGYRPESEKVFRLNDLDIANALKIDTRLSLREQNLLLRDRPEAYSPFARKIIGSGTNETLFKNIEIGGGSIGTSMARLWKGEVGGVLLKAGVQTPWDLCPVIGISRKLGFVYVELSSNNLSDGGRLIEFEPQPEDTLQTFKTETLVVHSSRLKALWKFFAAHPKK